MNRYPTPTSSSLAHRQPSVSSSSASAPARPSSAGPLLQPLPHHLTSSSTYRPLSSSVSPSPVPFYPQSTASSSASRWQTNAEASSSRQGYAESPYGGGVGGAYSRTTHELEGQNDDRLEGLMGKVKMLKDITIGIGDEVRASNLELGTMNDAFSQTSLFLSGTFDRMRRMSRTQGGQWCAFMLFLIFVGWVFVGVWGWRKVT